MSGATPVSRESRRSVQGGGSTERHELGRWPDAGAVDEALARIAAGADARDRAPEPVFPQDAFALLDEAGALAATARAGEDRPAAAQELRLVRAVARADASVGRIFDGHLNAVERLAVQAPGALRDAELAAVRAGALRAGVWGGEPVGHEGEPARVVDGPDGLTLRGVKTFCSGAGGLQRALVVARGPQDGGLPPVAAWVDLTATTTFEIDASWYRSSGLRGSVSHRIAFADTPVLALLGGGPGALVAQPWFARDALRTAASWAGMADAAADAALAELRDRAAATPDPSPLDALAAGRVEVHRATIDAWLERAARAMDGAPGETDGTPAPGLAATALHARVAIADAARGILRAAEGATGSRPFATGGPLDRARRDLELFLLQHRLDPMLARRGGQLLDSEAR